MEKNQEKAWDQNYVTTAVADPEGVQWVTCVEPLFWRVAFENIMRKRTTYTTLMLELRTLALTCSSNNARPPPVPTQFRVSRIRRSHDLRAHGNHIRQWAKRESELKYTSLSPVACDNQGNHSVVKTTMQLVFLVMRAVVLVLLKTWPYRWPIYLLEQVVIFKGYS